jgi:23S rRNA pseudouridine1911/1915/1917 synthase
MDISSRRFAFTVQEPQIGMRLDVVVSECLDDCSRSYAAQLIQGGAVQVNQVVCKPSYRVRPEDHVSGRLPEPVASEFLPEAMDLDILFEDSALIVINKPPGLVVHPAPGHPSGTLVNGLLHHCPDLAAFGGEIRPGIVHRLDKDTSGVMVVAKQPSSHEQLAKQFHDRSVRKTYLAIVQGDMNRSRGEITLPIGRHPTARKQMSTVSGKTRPAETRYRVREALNGATLLELDLKTGRTHQIRVHCAAIHHPVVGDSVYGGRNNAVIRRDSEPGKTFATQIERQMLHAWRLGFLHPVDGAWRQFEADMPEDMQALLKRLRPPGDDRQS